MFHSWLTQHSHILAFLGQILAAGLWRTSAFSSDLFGNGKMSFIRASKVSTNALGQLLGGKQAISFDHMTFGMNPCGFDRIEPGAFGGQKEGQNAHALALLLDEEVMLSDPSPHQLAGMKRGVIERLSNQQVLPCACRWVQHHCRNWVVMALTGRPSTKRSDIWRRVGSVAGPCCQSTP